MIDGGGKMIEWDDAYSVGISIIDEEHKRFIAIINRAVELEQSGGNQKEILAVINEMKRYAQTHFAEEETYMIRFNYPDYESHRKEHHAFFIETMAFFDRITTRNRPLICEILEHLKSWLVNHIQGVDIKYISCFKENGLR